MSHEGRILYSKREAANLLSISLRTLETLITQEYLSVCRIGRRVLLSSETLSAFATGAGTFDSRRDGTH